ncbi:MAG: hypothetical protein QOC82_1024 [Frankiaceae bacterium]|jgi:hypothetical protein|nr:hypothetical protein [Frankiaceae bacterium]MDQ1700542.1 hypothetical protein [Frankiaceae bacterium]
MAQSAATPIRPLNPLVYVNGQELTELQLQWLIEIRIETEMRLPGRLTLRFRDPDNALTGANQFSVGNTVVVKCKTDGQTVTMIAATITGMGYETTAGSDPRDRFDGRRGSIDEFFIVAHDNAYRLTRNYTVKGSEQAKASDVVSKLAAAADLTLNSTLSAGSTFPVLSQLHSDYDMLNAVADREGVDWWVAPTNTLHVGKATTTPSVTLKIGEDLTSFSMKGSDLGANTVSVRGYLSEQKQDLVKTAEIGDSTLWPSDVDLLNGFHKGTLRPSTATLVNAHTLPTDTTSSDTLAKGIRDRLAAAATQARGECRGNPDVVIGKSAKIEGAGPAAGTYHVTRVEHVVRRASFVTKFWAGDRKPTSIVDSLSSRPAPSLPARHYGLMLGIVTNLGSGENAGKLRVKFPTLDATLVSAWGRFVAPSAGPNGRGLVMLPEVGDEVLVGFEEGDMHRPVILGGLYVGADQSKAWPVQGDKITDRRYTSIGGHVVMVQDGDGDPNNMFKVTIKGKKGDVILRMGADKAEVTSPDGVPIELTAGGQSSIKFDGQGNIAIKGVKISIEAQAEIDIKSQAKIAIQAQAELDLAAQAKAELKGAMVNVTAQGPLAAKGAIVQIN